MKDVPFRDLLKLARTGDRGALSQLFQQYEGELTKVVKARLGRSLRPYFDSIDLIQSVHKSVMVGLRDDKLDIQSPQHLVRLAALIVRRKIARKWRRHQRQLRIDSPDRSNCDDRSLANLLMIANRNADDPIEGVAINERLESILVRLNPLDRELIQLRLAGCTTAEAARRLGQDSDVLRARLGRIRRRLNAAGITADSL